MSTEHSILSATLYKSLPLLVSYSGKFLYAKKYYTRTVFSTDHMLQFNNNNNHNELHLKYADTVLVTNN